MDGMVFKISEEGQVKGFEFYSIRVQELTIKIHSVKEEWNDEFDVLGKLIDQR